MKAEIANTEGSGDFEFFEIIRPVENGGTWASLKKDEGTFRTASNEEDAEPGRNDPVNCNFY